MKAPQDMEASHATFATGGSVGKTRMSKLDETLQLATLLAVTMICVCILWIS